MIQNKDPMPALNLKYVILFIIALISLNYCSSGGKNTVATVGKSLITVDDFRSELGIYRMNRQSRNIAPNNPRFFEIKKDILNSMIRERILLNEVLEKKITVPKNELKDRINLIKGDYKTDTFSKELRQNGINYAYWENKIKNQLSISKLTRSIINKNPEITDEEIGKYYESNKESFNMPEQVRAFQIVVKTEEEAYKIYKELKKGKKFEELAMVHSITPEGVKGGDLGYFSRGSMPKVFDNVLFKLRQGRISKVVASEYGYHILKVTDKKKSSIRPVEEVRNEIIVELKRSKKDMIFSEWFKEKIAKTKIKRNNSLLANIK